MLSDEILQKCLILGKPKIKEDAVKILSLLSDNTHYVLTGVAIRTPNEMRSFTRNDRGDFQKALHGGDLLLYRQI